MAYYKSKPMMIPLLKKMVPVLQTWAGFIICSFFKYVHSQTKCNNN